MSRPFLALLIPFLLTMASLPYARAADFHPAHHLSDIEYSRVDGLGLLMDADLPASAVCTPAVVIVHGGGWVRGDRRTDVRPLFRPLSDAGFAWFSIDYRLVKQITEFGVGVDDVEAAVAYIKLHATEFNIDPERIALVGESAGGQLAAMAVLRGGAAASVKTVVAFYTPTDLVALMRNSDLIPGQIRSSVIGTPWERLLMAGLQQLSPIDNVRKNMPPFLFIHGMTDSFVPLSQSTEMCNRMRAVGASCEVYPIENAGHGMRWWSSSAQRAADKKLIDWLRQQLGAPANVPA